MKDYAFGNLITNLRSEKGYSQYQLGRLVGVSDKAVSKWENGSAKPRMSTCCKLADVLGVSLDTLLSAGNPNQEKSEQIASWVPRAIRKEKQMCTRKDEASVKRVELHARTGYSALDGIGSPTDLIMKAAQWGHQAIAVTDFCSLQGFPMAFRATKRNGIKLIPGCELRMYADDAHYSHVMLLATCREGIVHLNHLMSLTLADCPFAMPGVTKEQLQQNRSGLLVGSSCDHGEIRDAILAGTPVEQLQRLAGFYDYMEIQPPENEGFDLQKARQMIRSTVRLGRYAGKPVVAVSNSHYQDAEDSICRSILQYNTGHVNYEDPGTLFIRTTDEMLQSLSFLGAKAVQQVVIDAPRTVAAQITPDISLYPPRIDPKATFLPTLPDAKQSITDSALKRAHEVYGDDIPPFVSDRLFAELKMIEKQDSWVHFIIAERMVSAAHSNGQYSGSRGAVGSSFVAWLVGITDINPLPPHYRCPLCKHSELTGNSSGAHIGTDLSEKVCPCCGTTYVGDGNDIPVETFLGLQGEQMPDIDLNFSPDCAAMIQAQLVDMFGKDHVIRAGTISTAAFYSGMRYVRQYMADHNQYPSEESVERTAEKLSDTVRIHSMHPGGYVIIPKEYSTDDFTAVEKVGNQNEWNTTTHFDFYSMHDVLMKCDCLAHDSFYVLHRLKELTGIDPYTVPVNDKQVISLFRSPQALGTTNKHILNETGTYGIPEFGTSFVCKMLMETQPTTVSELISISGLSHGTDIWAGNAEPLVQSGEVNLPDVPSVRDDIMNYLLSKGVERRMAYGIMDSVRRGRGLTEQMCDEMQQHSVEEWYIECCKKIKYMFPKAHAVSYVFTSLRIAWYKLYRPEAFYTAALDLLRDSLKEGDEEIDAMTLRSEILAERSDDRSPMWEKDRMRALELLLEAKERGIDLRI